MPTGHGLPLVDRFYRFVNKDGPIPLHQPTLGPCWDWTGTIHKTHGYGEFNLNKKPVHAHRLSWQLEQPDETLTRVDVIAHACDRRCCVRPEHLFKTTQAGNMADMLQKDRGKASVTHATVRAIRAAYAAGETRSAVLAGQFSVPYYTVCRIVKGQSFKHVT